jgi:hypothetical protein
VLEKQLSSFTDSIRDARQHLAAELHAQSEHIQKLSGDLAELRSRHERTEHEATRQWEEIGHAAEIAAAAASDAVQEAQAAPAKALDKVLGAVCNLQTCTVPDQVFEVLAEEASQWGVRAAIFDVRGKAAWGASARGFGPALSQKIVRCLIVQLSHENPFQQVCETGGRVDATAATLRKNRNVLEKLKPAANAPVLLLPIRSAGTVSAIFYADPGDDNPVLPVSALAILTEFAGAQIDRLIALSSGTSDEVAEEEALASAKPDGATESPVVETAGEEGTPFEHHDEEAGSAESHPDDHVTAEPRLEESSAPLDAHKPEPEALPEGAVAVAHAEPPAELVGALVPEPEPPALPIPEPATEVASAAAIEVSLATDSMPAATALAASAALDVSQLSEAEQKLHKDARRFAKLLVSEIELYNKSKVADGRKNGDLYKRLKSDIDRSRQTFEKRFGKSLDKQFDYFHDELVKTLAANDPTVLGPDYPGPSA